MILSCRTAGEAGAQRGKGSAAVIPKSVPQILEPLSRCPAPSISYPTGSAGLSRCQVSHCPWHLPTCFTIFSPLFHNEKKKKCFLCTQTSAEKAQSPKLILQETLGQKAREPLEKWQAQILSRFDGSWTQAVVGKRLT